MTLAIRHNDASPVAEQVRLAAQYPDAATWATESYRHVTSGLADVWPCQPNEERVRYYVWAARQTRECHDALTKAWDLLFSAFTVLNTVAEQLDEFQKTGIVPTIDDADLDPERSPLVAALLDDAIGPTRPLAIAPAKPSVPRLTTRKAPRTRRNGRPLPHLTIQARVLDVLRSGISGSASEITTIVVTRGGRKVGVGQVSNALQSLRYRGDAVGTGRSPRLTWSASSDPSPS